MSLHAISFKVFGDELYSAIEGENLEMIQFLYTQLSLDFDWLALYSRSPLDAAMASEQVEIVKWLHGMSSCRQCGGARERSIYGPSEKNVDKWLSKKSRSAGRVSTLAFVKAFMGGGGDLASVQELYSRGAHGVSYQTGLQLAASFGHVAVVQWLFHNHRGCAFFLDDAEEGANNGALERGH